MATRAETEYEARRRRECEAQRRVRAVCDAIAAADAGAAERAVRLRVSETRALRLARFGRPTAGGVETRSAVSLVSPSGTADAMTGAREAFRPA